MDPQERTLFVGNLPDKTTDEILYELFLQTGPLDKVHIPKEKSYAFVQFKHEESVAYTLRILEGISLFGKTLNLRPRTRSNYDNFSPMTSGMSRPSNRSSEESPRRDHNRGASPYKSPYMNQQPVYDQYASSRSGGSYSNQNRNYDNRYLAQNTGYTLQQNLPNMQPGNGRRVDRHHRYDLVVSVGSSRESRESNSSMYKSNSYRHDPYKRY